MIVNTSFHYHVFPYCTRFVQFTDQDHSKYVKSWEDIYIYIYILYTIIHMLKLTCFKVYIYIYIYNCQCTANTDIV